MVDHSEWFAEIVVDDLLASRVLSLANRPGFSSKLGFPPTAQGLYDVSDGRTCLWLTREYGCLNRRDSLVDCTHAKRNRFDLTATI